MARVLINDGIHPTGLKMLQEAGFEVSTENIPQDKLPTELPKFNAICVRSATKVRKDLIDLCPDLKVIGRGGVGLDNIDVDYARSKGINVCNTPAASSRSVAELVFAHLFSVSRSLYKSNQQMPAKGQDEFKALKKAYSKGQELYGKKLGVIGFGRIGQETAKIGIGIGMEVIAVDPFIKEANLKMKLQNNELSIPINTVAIDDMLSQADVITLHIPFTGKPALSKEHFDKMKDGVVIVNAARGGTIDESALLDALNSGKVSAAGLDVYENEPKPRVDLLQHVNVSCTPHIGASTGEAQEKISIELAEQLITHLS